MNNRKLTKNELVGDSIEKSKYVNENDIETSIETLDNNEDTGICNVDNTDNECIKDTEVCENKLVEDDTALCENNVPVCDVTNNSNCENEQIKKILNCTYVTVKGYVYNEANSTAGKLINKNVFVCSILPKQFKHNILISLSENGIVIGYVDESSILV